MNKKNIKQPKIGKKIINKSVNLENESAIMGDFEEEFRSKIEEKGISSGWIWYWIQVIKSFPAFIFNSLFWSFVMFKSYLKSALRNLKKQKFYSFINIFGLAVGMAVCILLFTYIYDSYSYDRFHKNSENIFRITTELSGRDKSHILKMAESPRALAVLTKEEFPEVIKSTRITKVYVFGEIVSFEDKNFYESNAWSTDNSFFDFFPAFRLLKGNPADVLDSPNSVVINEKTAKKYFGDDEPIGKILNISDKDFIVTGIVQNCPENSHLQFDILTSVYRYDDTKNNIIDDDFINIKTLTYIRLPEKYNYKNLEEKFPAFIKKHVPEQVASRVKFFIQPLTDIHLYSNFNWVHSKNGVIRYIYFYASIALLILLIACFNYIILSIASSSTRSKEVGIRKVIGAKRKQIVSQFWGEFIFLCFIAVFLGLGIAHVLLPEFNTLVNKNLVIRFNAFTFMSIIILTIIIGVAAGSLPSLLLSGFKPVNVFRSRIKLGGANKFNKTLLLLQFSLSAVLILSTIVMSGQMNYLKNKDLGFIRENAIVIPFHKWDPPGNKNIVNSLRDELQSYKNIISITGTPFHIIKGTRGSSEIKHKDKNIPVTNINVDFGYLKTMGLTLLKGRDFSEKRPSDKENSIIVNESFVNEFDIKDPLGYIFKKKRIVGVVKDFHYESLYKKIEPLMLYVSDWNVEAVSFRIIPENIRETINLIRTKWKKLAPDQPFDYSFADEKINSLYDTDQRLSSAVKYSTIFSIIIACLGILGLTGISVTNRTKEIAIRKTFGASVISIIKLLSAEYTKLLLLSIIISFPAGYFVLNKWIQTFSYRINIGVEIFVLSALVSFSIAFLSISYRTLKAAGANPVDSLRYE